jgi:glutamyl endopeptidase
MKRRSAFLTIMPALLAIVCLQSSATEAQAKTKGPERSVSDLRGEAAASEVAPGAGAGGLIGPSPGLAKFTGADLASEGVQLVGDDVGPLPPSELVQDMMAREKNAETVLNWDSRMRVVPTAAMANRAIVLITIGTSNAHLCTGFLYSNNTVATAGHCVHTGGSSGTWRDRTTMKVWPGRNGTASPYGFCTVRRLHSVAGWTLTANQLYDYGAMKLNCTVGNTTGWFGMRSQDGDTAFLNQPAIISGYPGDKSQEQWLSADKVRVSQSLRLCYRTDTIGGHSGSPIWNDRDEALGAIGPWAIAVHAYGAATSSCGTTLNSGPRLTPVRISNYVLWRDMP